MFKDKKMIRSICKLMGAYVLIGTAAGTAVEAGKRALKEQPQALLDDVQKAYMITVMMPLILPRACTANNVDVEVTFKSQSITQEPLITESFDTGVSSVIGKPE